MKISNKCRKTICGNLGAHGPGGPRRAHGGRPAGGLTPRAHGPTPRPQGPTAPPHNAIALTCDSTTKLAQHVQIIRDTLAFYAYLRFVSDLISYEFHICIWLVIIMHR